MYCSTLVGERVLGQFGSDSVYRFKNMKFEAKNRFAKVSTYVPTSDKYNRFMNVWKIYVLEFNYFWSSTVKIRDTWLPFS